MELLNINPTYKTIGIVTFTSAGYVEVTQNLCNSNIQNNVNFNINIFCLDEQSYNHDFGLNTKNISFFENSIKAETEKNMMRQDSQDFGSLMVKKFKIIYKSLLEFDNLIYIDGDIVIKKDFIEELTYDYKHKDIVFQNDKRPSKPNQINLCAGFMLIKSNKKMLKFFNPENIPTDLFDKYKTHDQTYINKSKSKFNYNILSLDSFPNGPKYYENHSTLDPSIIHFNYVRGEEKISLMKKYNEWYL
tara:strand:- start:1347 stop:2084 length:738 start_codon:yes stop_codon:yes gene_type:complete